MARIVSLNGYGHGYVEKIKFQLCFGVLLMGVSSPISPAYHTPLRTDIEEKGLRKT
jgi:hypothetical protein